MKKIIILLLTICLLCTISACNSNKQISTESTPAPTEEIAAYVVPKTFSNREEFISNIIADHTVYNETGKLSDYCLAKIQYYLDFEALPEDAILKDITVSQSCNYISLTYIVSGKEMSLTWYRANFGENYDYYENQKALTSGMPQKQINFKDLKILEVYHTQSNGASFDHYSYHWEQNGDYIDLIVDPYLVDLLEATSILSIGKINIDFGSITPAVVPTPQSPTPSPIPEKTPAPTMAAPDA